MTNPSPIKGKMRPSDGADYILYGHCQYGVPSNNISQVSDCGDDGIAWIWWDSQDQGLKVCRKHLDKILLDEEQSTNQLWKKIN